MPSFTERPFAGCFRVRAAASAAAAFCLTRQRRHEGAASVASRGQGGQAHSGRGRYNCRGSPRARHVGHPAGQHVGGHDAGLRLRVYAQHRARALVQPAAHYTREPVGRRRLAARGSRWSAPLRASAAPAGPQKNVAAVRLRPNQHLDMHRRVEQRHHAVQWTRNVWRLARRLHQLRVPLHHRRGPSREEDFFGGLAEVALSMDMLAAYVLGGLAWQITAIMFTLAPVPVFMLQSYIVESPRWFATKGRYRDANTAMVRLYGDDVPTDFRYSRTGEDSNISTMGRQKVVSRWSPAQARATRWDALGSVGMLLLAYSVGLCHVPPLVIGELIPLKKWRYLSASVLWVWRWLITFVMVHFGVDVLRTGAYKSLSLAFGLALLLVAAAAIPFLPETEGRTLAAIHRDE